MADVKWVKLTTDMFDNRKIKHLRRLPEGNNIVLIWVMLLTMAGRCNAGGMIFLTENIPYTPKMLADELGFEESTVNLALTALQNFSMIVTDQGHFRIAGWEEYQNIDGLDKIREQTRQRVAKCREKKLLTDCSVTSSVTVTQCNALEEDLEERKELNLEEKISCQQIVDLFHSICVSYPKVKSISDARKKAINARLKTYTLEDFETVFRNAEESSFMKGSNDRNWSANFDWMIADKNMAKILEGNYADKTSKKGKVAGWTGFQPGEAELEAIRQQLDLPYIGGD